MIPADAAARPDPSPGAAVPRLTDSHCHLDFPDFAGELPAVVARAGAAGVWRMVTICTRLRDEPAVRAIAETFPQVWYAVATHPMSVADEPMASVEQLVALARHPRLVGIGETGLDYHYSSDSAAAQQQSLRIHIEAARRTGLPLIIHARDADADMARILTDEHRAAPFACVMHCFSSGPELAAAAVDLGFYLSMSGITAFRNSEALREIFRTVPHERLLVETDSPYLAPPPHRGRRNEPAFVADTARRAAESLGLDFADLAALTEANFERLFTKVTRPPAPATQAAPAPARGQER